MTVRLTAHGLHVYVGEKVSVCGGAYVLVVVVVRIVFGWVDGGFLG